MPNRGLKILFASHIPYSRKLGATKVLLELGDELEKLGWTCQYDGPTEIAGAAVTAGEIEPVYHLLLRDHLIKHAGEFDVVDYDHQYLPFDRELFPASTLFVARSVLCTFHFEHLRIPKPVSWKSVARRFVCRGTERAEIHRRITQATTTLNNADLINVSCHADEKELRCRGLAKQKTIVMPFGLGVDRLESFNAVRSAAPDTPPVIGFVGTFDYRKGCLDLPKIFTLLRKQIPAARLRLMGTKGLFQTVEDVRRFFPQRLHDSVDVILSYSPQELPALLANCSVGVFPSYVEGFGIGVLEMLASSIPVVAYRSPGPPDMLPEDCLADRGDVAGMAEKLARLLLDRETLVAKRIEAKAYAQRFNWPAIAAATNTHYRSFLEKL